MFVRRTIESSGCDASRANIRVVPLRSGPATKIGAADASPTRGRGGASSAVIRVALQEFVLGEAVLDRRDPRAGPLDHRPARLGLRGDNRGARIEVARI